MPIGLRILSLVASSIVLKYCHIMTRFAEMILWQKSKNPWQYFKGLFGIWQSNEHTLAQFNALGQI